jgi:hypothetical protein
MPQHGWPWEQSWMYEGSNMELKKKHAGLAVVVFPLFPTLINWLLCTPHYIYTQCSCFTKSLVKCRECYIPAAVKGYERRRHIQLCFDLIRVNTDMVRDNVTYVFPTCHGDHSSSGCLPMWLMQYSICFNTNNFDYDLFDDKPYPRGNAASDSVLKLITFVKKNLKNGQLLHCYVKNNTLHSERWQPFHAESNLSLQHRCLSIQNAEKFTMLSYSQWDCTTKVILSEYFQEIQLWHFTHARVRTRTHTHKEILLLWRLRQFMNSNV